MSEDKSTQPLTPSQAMKLLDTIAFARIEIIHLGEVLDETRDTFGQVGDVLSDANTALRDVEDRVISWLEPERTPTRRPMYRVAAELRHVHKRLRKHLRDSFRPRAPEKSEGQE